MAGKIFVNYRRGDDPGFAQALFGRLEQAFSHEQLFMDVDNIAPGLDFVRVLDERVAECDVVLAVIGKGWIEARDAGGSRRLDDPDDFVRIEIVSALSQGKRVIPVLVGDAQMPRREDLPEALQPLVRRNAVRLTHERFRADTQGLVRALQQGFEEMEAARQAEAEAARRAQDEAERKRQEAEAERRAEEEAARKRAELEAQERATAERRRQDAAAKQRAGEKEALTIAKRAGTTAALDAFLAIHPESYLADEARKLKALLLAREEAFQRAMVSDAPAVLESFLATYRKGDDADQVRARLRVLAPPQSRTLAKPAVLIPSALAIVLAAGAGFAWLATKSPSSSTQQAAVMASAPTVPAVVSAPAVQSAGSTVQPGPSSVLNPDEVAWLLIKDTTDEAALRRFVQRYPDSPLRKEAEARIATLVADTAAKAEAALKAQIGQQAAEAALRAQIAQQAEAAAAAKLEAERAKAAAAAQVAAGAQPATAPTAPQPSDQQAALATPPSDALPSVPPSLTGSALVLQIKRELQRVGCYAGKLDDDWSSSVLQHSLAKFVKAASLTKAPDQPTADLLDTIRGQPSRVCPLECAKTERESNGKCIAKTCPSGQKLDSDGDCETVKERTVSRPAKSEAPAAPAQDVTRGLSNVPIPGKECERRGGRAAYFVCH
jgi:hypothetical protein